MPYYDDLDESFLRNVFFPYPLVWSTSGCTTAPTNTNMNVPDILTAKNISRLKLNLKDTLEPLPPGER